MSGERASADGGAERDAAMPAQSLIEEAMERTAPAREKSSQRAGRDSEIQALVATYNLELVRLALLLVDDTSLAQEIVDESFLTLHRRLALSTARPDPLLFLRQAVVQYSREVIAAPPPLASDAPVTVARHRAPEPVEAPADQAPNQTASQAADQPPGQTAESFPDYSVDEGYPDHPVMDAVSSLSGIQREIVVLRHWAGLTVPQTAEVLRMSTSAVDTDEELARESIATELARGW